MPAFGLGLREPVTVGLSASGLILPTAQKGVRLAFGDRVKG